MEKRREIYKWSNVIGQTSLHNANYVIERGRLLGLECA